MKYNKALSLKDFAEPEFHDMTRSVFAHWIDGYPKFPIGVERAKVWEVCQAIRGLHDHGALGEDKELLGVGAGHEHTVFYLTNHARRVFATDLYEVGTSWQEAPAGMLQTPEKFTVKGFQWRPRRLVVQHMNACDLRYEDESFDGIFSCGSIEHFGAPEDVAQAAREMGRVLKPGGILTLSTEYRVSGPSGLGLPGSILFTREMLEDFIIKPSGLVLVDELEGEVDEATIDSAYPLDQAIAGNMPDRSICLTKNDYVWTSVALCLRRE